MENKNLINALVDRYFETREKIYEHFGYEPGIGNTHVIENSKRFRWGVNITLQELTLIDDERKTIERKTYIFNPYRPDGLYVFQNLCAVVVVEDDIYYFMIFETAKRFYFPHILTDFWQPGVNVTIS